MPMQGHWKERQSDIAIVKKRYEALIQPISCTQVDGLWMKETHSDRIWNSAVHGKNKNTWQRKLHKSNAGLTVDRFQMIINL